MKKKSPLRCETNRGKRVSSGPTSSSTSSSSGRGFSRSSLRVLPTTHPTATATRNPSAIRPSTITQSVSRPRYATNVDAMTTGLRIGAASMNVTAADGIRPFACEPPGDGHRPALADRERDPGERGGRQLQRARQPTEMRERRRRHEHLDRGRDERAEQDERRRLHEQRAEDDQEVLQPRDAFGIGDADHDRDRGQSADHDQPRPARRPRPRGRDLRARDVDGHQQYLENEIANPGYASANSGVPSDASIASMARTTSSDVMSFAAMTA